MILFNYKYKNKSNKEKINMIFYSSEEGFIKPRGIKNNNIHKCNIPIRHVYNKNSGRRRTQQKSEGRYPGRAEQPVFVEGQRIEYGYFICNFIIEFYKAFASGKNPVEAIRIPLQKYGRGNPAIPLFTVSLKKPAGNKKNTAAKASR